MFSSWKLWCCFFSICSQLFTAVTQELKLEPMESTVLQGSDVQFSATVQGNWQIMTWDVGGFKVLTVRAPAEIIPSSERFSARFCSSGVPTCVEFTIHNVTRTLAGSVVCSVQGQEPIAPQTAELHVEESGTVSITGGNVTVKQDQQVELQCLTAAWFPTPSVIWSQNGQAVNSSLYNTTSTADGDYFNSTSILKIQAVSDMKVGCMASLSTLKTPQSSFVFVMIAPKPPDWTVLISVVVSFGSCALLVLIILGIIFFYKRRKEKDPTYQDEMKRVRTQSQLGGAGAAEQRKGQMNPSYVPDSQNSVISNVFQESVQNNLKMPNNGRRNPVETNNTAGELGFVKHRHVTIV